MSKKVTVGKMATDLAAQDTVAQSPIELEREVHKEYEQNFHDCLERGKKQYTGDFFIVVLTKKERLLPNVLRHYFLHRTTCPTPDYDQAVYHYHRQHDGYEFLWVIPDKNSCKLMIQEALHLPESQHDLLRFVLDYADGELMKKAKKLNGEQESSPLIIV
jgi:hypothetical protein